MVDNVDRNSHTIADLGTSHAMGMMAVMTPASTETHLIPMQAVKSEDIKAISHVNITNYNARDETRPLTYKALVATDVEDETLMLDPLWKISLPVRSPTPGWARLI